MKRVVANAVKNPLHRQLQRKDERELYGRSPVDYYALHYRRRIGMVGKIIRKRKCRRVLEVGAAQGNMALCCAEAGIHSVALDIVFEHLTYGRLKYDKGAIQWLHASADALPFRSGTFDAVILGELLEHCAWPERILTHAAELLTAHGVIIITTPNNNSALSMEQPFSAVAADRAAIERHQFGPDGDDHLFTFTDRELAAVIAACRLAVRQRVYLGNHFLHLARLYHIRTRMPFLFNGMLETVVPLIPGLRRRYTDTLLFVVENDRRL
ncbi:MAG: methyltransferase domain-containing protein [Chitinispirillaceae bacterium]|nr:methyltransferase domain-containing protein [Chitinispirillaceae bacterium]